MAITVRTASSFEPYWDNLTKHEKRLTHWVPSLRRTLRESNAEPPAKILALLSVEMIDVFLFAREGLLGLDDTPPGGVNGVVCVGCCQDTYRDLGRLLGARSLVLKGNLEEIALFKDDEATRGLQTEAEINDVLSEIEAKDMDEKFRARLELKRQALVLASEFPFDFINLDFCDTYYPAPPLEEVDDIHRAVERILHWQEDQRGWKTFSLAVTWRHLPQEMPPEGRALLREAAARNMGEVAGYGQLLAARKGVAVERDLEDWCDRDQLDFCCSVWPKTVLQLGSALRWSSEIEYMTHYARRTRTRQLPFQMVSGVFRFTRPGGGRAKVMRRYASEAQRMLDPQQRAAIPDHAPDSPRGQELTADLLSVWELRNEHALQIRARELTLPPPNPKRTWLGGEQCQHPQP